MKLTNRRKQFLEQIVQMYSETNEPIHYKDIAELIGVSKWTAYDMLKELEKSAFLERTYVVNQNETGRSMVVYVPTDKSIGLFDLPRKNINKAEEWEKIKHEVQSFIKRNSGCEKPIEPLLEILTKVELKVELCAYFIAVLLIYLNRQGETIKGLTINLLNVSKTPVIQLSTFAGAVIGMIIDSASDEISPEMVNLVKQFMDTFEELNEEELKYMIDFINEA
ncbi:Lrp/AsnC family transcriptional regulator [Bacillus sp. 31A1R]|uniref:Lrp/AsnC family transcriptional regulator n=1 Tax=Robertmurraya mangrovi TaxID=3098077 RepID=A0ABU5J0Y6_9BACI|nr:Lrp/AsnC family transcriptional regulator [Bacillus sp. 31A1R]MDZ5473085.1 Lrp/AsnC family transcriptional regulator [Bacillus sp. 31A1R]